MPPHYDSIRLAAWTSLERGTTFSAEYWTLSFPEHWPYELRRLCDPEAEQPRPWIPTAGFEQVIQAFLPEILVLPRPRRRGEERAVWLAIPVDRGNPPEQVFSRLVREWLGVLRPEPEYRDLLKEVRAAMLAKPIMWEKTRLELLDCPVSEGLTAGPLRHQYRLLTDSLAQSILELGPYPVADGALGFHPVARGYWDRGAQLVSRPLRLPPRKGYAESFFSVAVTVTLHAVPFDSLPRIHFQISRRRWATRPTGVRVPIPRHQRTTVLLRPGVPFLSDAPPSERMAVAHLGYRKNERTGAYEPEWSRYGSAGLLSKIIGTSGFPDATTVLDSSRGLLVADMRVAITYSTAMKGHGAGGGFMPEQRSQFMEWIDQAMPQEMRRVPSLTSTSVLTRSAPDNKPRRRSRAHAEIEAVRMARVRREAAAVTVGRLDPRNPKVLTVRLLWQSEEMRDILARELAGFLGLEGPGKVYEDGLAEVEEWDSPELTVRLRSLRLTGGLAEGLKIPSSKRRPTEQQVIGAVRRRRGLMKDFLAADGAGGVPAVAIVELDGRDGFTSVDHDPKFALRQGGADADVLTQFIAVPRSQDDEGEAAGDAKRAESSWRDLLRQLGVSIHAEPDVTVGVPERLRFLALRAVVRNRTRRSRWSLAERVALLITPDQEGRGFALTEGWDAEADGGVGEWVPYPVLLLRMARRAEAPRWDDEQEGAPARTPEGRPWGKREEAKRRTEEWLQKVLWSVRRKPVAILAEAQNIRGSWTWMQDSVVEVNRLQVGTAPPRPLDPWLRIIRVRTADNGETPGWWGVNPKDGDNGLPAHLWRFPDSDLVFLSSTPKASQKAGLRVGADMLGPEGRKSAWNPRLLEIAVLGCHPGQGDSPEALAAVAHQLRQPADYPDALAVPFPLHLARKAAEYAVPTVFGEEEMEEEVRADESLLASPLFINYPDASDRS